MCFTCERFPIKPPGLGGGLVAMVTGHAWLSDIDMVKLILEKKAFAFYENFFKNRQETHKAGEVIWIVAKEEYLI